MKKSAVSMVVIISLLLSSGLLFAQQAAPKERPARPMMERMNRMGARHEAMMKKLNLTDQQKQKMADLKIDFQKKMVDLKADLQKSKLDLKALRVKGDLNRSDVIAAVEKVNKNKNAISVAVANHMLDVYEILTPEQQKIWKENGPMMNKRIHRGGMMQHKWMTR